ncbi:DUF645 family protein [Vibrio cholerae]|nr:DUF645 family protein [Vibrio cholerae]MBJ6962087.1 DUF645 family protein [Vibrio cholerae]HAS3601927.1 DUF645 family protein [Vibrio cholerae]
MFNTVSLVSQMASSLLKLCFLCHGSFNRGQLNLDRFKFWQPTSQLLALDVCLCDAFA